MKTLIESLKASDKIKTIYATNDEKIILVENLKKTLFVINARTIFNGQNKTVETLGYQWSHPIKPNRTTGSGLIGTDDYFDFIDFTKMLPIAENNGYNIPNFFKPSERATVKFWESAEEKASAPGSIWHNKIK